MANFQRARIDSPLNSPSLDNMHPASAQPHLSVQDKKQIHGSLGTHDKARCCISATDDVAYESRLSFEYLNKGAANVVFKICPFSPSSSRSSLQIIYVENDGDVVTPLPYQGFANQVLRVSRGKPKHLLGETILSGFKDAVHPLFVPGQLNTLKLVNGPGGSSATPRQVPVKLQTADLTKHLMEHEGVLLMASAMEHLLEETEPDTFHSDKVQKDQLTSRLGILLPDMSHVPGESITLEVKPKWLLQSPNAPRNAVRCRTCALQVAMPKDRETYVCPLRLVNGNARDIRSWALNSVVQSFRNIGNASTSLPTESVVSAIVDGLLDYLTNGEGRTLLRYLRFLQRELDAQGVLLRDQMYPKELFDHNLRLAMTLRDCSLFVRIPYNARGAVAASQIVSKLGDLDFKSAEKMDDWKAKELSLQADGMYTKLVKDDLGCWMPHLQEVQVELA